MHGKGQLIYESGNVFSGTYVNDLKEGPGVYIWANGKKIEGIWKNGKQEGEGKYTNEQGLVRIGFWEKGERLRWADRTEQSERSIVDNITL